MPAPSRPWDSRCFRAATPLWDAPKRPRERDDRAATLRPTGGGQRFQRTPPDLAEAPAPPAAAGTRTQRPEPLATSQPAATAATRAGLGSRSVAALRRLYTCESASKWLICVRIGQAARLVQHAAVTVG